MRQLYSKDVVKQISSLNENLDMMTSKDPS